MAPPRTSGWDPILLISQIVSMQTLHYLTLSVLIPPLLAAFAEHSALDYAGGAANVGMVMDWHEMAGYPTAAGESQGGSLYGDVWIGGGRISGHDPSGPPWAASTDPIRGWIIGLCWILASGVDIYYLYTLVRKPRQILDFALTLVFNHLVLTTYYSASVPRSLFFWVVLAVGAAGTVTITEQLCVKREMNEGLAVPAAETGLDEMEMGGILRRD